jgi:hypothetical protein
MVSPRGLALIDRNGDRRECIGETFNTGHQILVLIRDDHAASTTIIVPGTQKYRAILGKLAGRF